MSEANNNTLLYLGPCLLFSFFSPFAQADNPQDIQQLRSLSYLLKPGDGWAPNAVQRYLSSTASDLGSAAAKLTL